MFENRMWRKIFGPKMDEVRGERRRLHYDELHAVFLTKHYAGDKIKKNEMGGACDAYGERRGVCRVLVA